MLLNAGGEDVFLSAAASDSWIFVPVGSMLNAGKTTANEPPEELVKVLLQCDF